MPTTIPLTSILLGEDDDVWETYDCSDCSRSFTSKAGLTRHKRKEHGYTKPPQPIPTRYDEETLEWMVEKSDANILRMYGTRKNTSKKMRRKLEKLGLIEYVGRGGRYGYSLTIFGHKLLEKYRDE